MKEEFNDELMPENYEEIARAYSKALRKKGFVFVKLEEEEFNLLLGEVFVILSKMEACLDAICSLDSQLLQQKIQEVRDSLQEEFGQGKNRKFVCKMDENSAFLTLVSLQNLLVIKLMLLSIKSGQLEVCNSAITSICAVFAESFPLEGFEIL